MEQAPPVPPITEAIANLLRDHQLTRGMAVAMGSTCACGYWSGREEPGKTRPVGFQGLMWHQAEVIAKALGLANPEEDTDA